MRNSLEIPIFSIFIYVCHNTTINVMLISEFYMGNLFDLIKKKYYYFGRIKIFLYITYNSYQVKLFPL